MYVFVGNGELNNMKSIMKKIKNKNIELLIPVGGKIQLVAAVNSGADAVYMGGAGFNAREYAENFRTIEEIKWAVEYAHLRGVKVYITLNTLVKDTEMKEALEYAKKLYIIGVDAVIVQDLGLLDLLYKKLPDFPVHISTQATIYSVEGIKALEKYTNISRVVLARELSLEEIAKVADSTAKEIEVFVHGALCVSYSGQCLMSSYIGARSGNRGKCAGTCRLKYGLIDDNEYAIKNESELLSLKDLCTIDILPQVINTGVISLKIEGRMKSPEYVSVVTRTYRKYLDKALSGEKYVVTSEEKQELLQVFNRGNFSTGYLEGKNLTRLWCDGRPKHWGTYLGKVVKTYSGKNNIDICLDEDVHIGDGIEVLNDSLSGCVISYIRSGNNRVNEEYKGSIVTIGDIRGNIKVGQEVYKITSKKLNDEIKSWQNKEVKKINIDVSGNFEIGKRMQLTFTFGKISHTEYGSIYEKGMNKTLNKEDIINQLSKLGEYSFKIDKESIKENIHVDQSGMISTSEINKLRNEVATKFQDKIIQSYMRNLPKKQEGNNKENPLEKINTYTNNDEKKESKPKISAYIYDLSRLESLNGFDNVSRVYISFEQLTKNTDREVLKKLRKYKSMEIFIYLPPVTNNKYLEFVQKNEEVIGNIDGILITNLEHIMLFQKYGKKLWADYTFNIFNSNATKMIQSLGVSGLNISGELNLEEVKNIKGDISKEVAIYGLQRLMYMEYCVIGKSLGCNKCKNSKYSLKDRMGKKFPVITSNICCNNSILNSKEIYVPEVIKELENIEYFRINILDETEVEIKTIVSNIYGLINGGEENNIDKFKYTTGHWYRGV